MEVKNNYTFFSIKTIACFCIIMIHCSFLGNIGSALGVFSRWAVPFFFMISGYYFGNIFIDSNEKKINLKIKKIFTLLVNSVFLYFIINIFINLHTNKITEYINDVANINNLWKLLIFNWTTPYIGVGHIWYLLTILYVYILFKYIIKKKVKSTKFLFIYSILILSIAYILEIIFTLINIPLDGILVRNFFVMGLPLFMIGYYIRQNNYLNRNNIFAKIHILSILYVIIFAFELVLFKGKAELYLSAIILNLLLFKIAINNPSIKIGWKIGKDYSGYIYIFHYAFIMLLNITNIEMLNKILYYLYPIIVFTLSLIFSCLFKKVVSGLKKEKTK